MQYRKLGNSDLNASVVSIGTWQMGNGEFWSANMSERESINTIRAAYDAGINLIDTAHIYGAGRSETIVGKAVKEIGRDKVIVATKCGVWFSSGIEYDESTKCLQCDEHVVTTQIEQSMRRLDIDYIDLYQAHYAGVTPPEEAMEAMMKMKQQGKIRYIGISNFTFDEMRRAFAVAPVVSYQPEFSMLNRINQPQMDFCRENNVGVITYGSIAGGILSGKYRSLANMPTDQRNEKYPYYDGEAFAKILLLLKVFDEIAQNHGKPVSHVAINWVVQQPSVTSAIVGMKSPAQAKETASAGDWELSPEEINLIDTKYAELFLTE